MVRMAVLRALGGCIAVLAFLIGTALGAADCDGNGIDDAVEIQDGSAADCNSNGVPDGCETASVPAFEALRRIPIQVSPDGIITGDLDRDGHPDLAVLDYYGQALEIVLGDGEGGLRELPPTALGQRPEAVLAADLDGDGILDLAVALYQEGEKPGLLSILIGDGAGTFRPTVDLPLPDGLHRIASADFDGNGTQDIVVSASEVTVFLGNGDGTFRDPRTLGTNISAYDLVAGQFDGDGIPDLVTGDRDGKALCILPGNGDGTFRSTRTQEGKAPEGNSFELAGDLDGDGRPEIALVNQRYGTTTILAARGDGALATIGSYSTFDMPNGAILADLDSDGRLDLITSHRTDALIRYRLGNGDGTFSGPSPKEIVFSLVPEAILVADLNGDLIQDLAATVPDEGKVRVLLGKGNLGFDPPADYGTGLFPQYCLVSCDIDADGDLDLFTTNFYNDAVDFLRNRGDGTFESPRSLAAGDRPLRIVTGDFDGDGHTDLAVGSMGIAEITILPGNGDGTFRPVRRIPVSHSQMDLKAADLDGDGILDLLFAAQEDGFGPPDQPAGEEAGILLGRGDGTFRTGHLHGDHDQWDHGRRS